MTDTIESLRAKLAEVERERDAVLWERNAIEDRLATAIAQSAEARGRLAEIEIEMRMMLPPGKTLLEILRERVAVRVALGGNASPLADDDSLLRAQCALASCAELRAALERMIKYAVEDRATTPGSTRLERQITRANCLLARTNLGRGMVAVPGPIDALVDRLVLAVCDCHDGSDLWAHTSRDPETFRRAVRGALLDGGKERG